MGDGSMDAGGGDDTEQQVVLEGIGPGGQPSTGAGIRGGEGRGRDAGAAEVGPPQVGGQGKAHDDGRGVAADVMDLDVGADCDDRFAERDDDEQAVASTRCSAATW
ncbi:hypothetical protein Q2K19_21835 [Micromonospora soli]|nr:hypothetical protein [Micromonospora sp. NBRC 110009]WKT96828.1 hypothetical protein Q2K19_21835 [Micromonospora sp. NBRC 110009]